MSIASEVSRIKDNVADAYTACDEKGADMPQTRNSANLADTIESIRNGGVTIIDDETSSGWGNDIPDTYPGETGEAGELALYLDTLWYLSEVVTVQGVDRYAWYAVATLTDLNYKMDYARNLSNTAVINALHEGQVFTTNLTVGVKTAPSGTAGDRQAYSTDYSDDHFLRESQFAQQTINPSLSEQDLAVYDKKVGEHFIGSGTEIYEVTQTGGWGCHINRLQQTRDKVTSVSSSSTDAQYPTAKCVFDELAGKANVGDIPTKTSELINDSGFLTQHQSISGKENTSNKVNTLSSSSTYTQYPSAKCVVDNALLYRAMNEYYFEKGANASLVLLNRARNQVAVSELLSVADGKGLGYVYLPKFVSNGNSSGLCLITGIEVSQNSYTVSAMTISGATRYYYTGKFTDTSASVILNLID